MSHVARLARLRFTRPEAFAHAMQVRAPGSLPDGRGALFIAADHHGRGALAAGDDPMAMADREDYLNRLLIALVHPRVTGFLGTPDIVEDLAVLGALEGKLVLGSMNRSGIAGARYAVADRVTAYDVPGIVGARLDGGKLLLRIDPSDPATPTMLERTGAQVSALAEAGRIAMVEPFMARSSDGGPVNELDTDSVVRSIAVASALGNTSARTWLKVPCVDDMPRAMAATSLPCLMLGGDVPADAGATLERWHSALRLPNVMGLVLGRALLFPRDGDVAANVDAIAEVL